MDMKRILAAVLLSILTAFPASASTTLQSVNVYLGALNALGVLTGDGGTGNMVAFSSVIGVIPPTTPVITATPGDTTNTITLTSGDVGALTNILYWDTTSRASYNLYANSISNATLVAASFPGTPYVHTGRTNGTPYYYRLCGTDLAGQTCSSEVSGTPAGGGSLTTGYYYMTGKSSSSFTTDDGGGNSGVTQGTLVTITGSGSGFVDKLGMKVDMHTLSSALSLLICLRNSSTGACLASCLLPGDASNGPAWKDCTLSSHYAVTNGNYIVTWEAETALPSGQNDAGACYSGDLAYTGACASWTPANQYNTCSGTRLHVE